MTSAAHQLCVYKRLNSEARVFVYLRQFLAVPTGSQRFLSFRARQSGREGGVHACDLSLLLALNTRNDPARLVLFGVSLAGLQRNERIYRRRYKYFVRIRMEKSMKLQKQIFIQVLRKLHYKISVRNNNRRTFRLSNYYHQQ